MPISTYSPGLEGYTIQEHPSARNRFLPSLSGRAILAYGANPGRSNGNKCRSGP